VLLQKNAAKTVFTIQLQVLRQPSWGRGSFALIHYARHEVTLVGYGDGDVTTHDPRQVIEDLRNHLAAHDRRLTFLFGAGTSSAVNIAPAPLAGQRRAYQPLIPGNEGLTQICGAAVDGMGDLQAAAWKTLANQCEQAGDLVNVESMLSRVRLKMEAIAEGELLAGLSRDQLRAIEKTICGAIAKTVTPADDTVPTNIPHHDFAAWVKKVSRTAPLELFTTNYDVLFERAFEASRVPVFDGFVGTNEPFFYPECLEDDALLPNSRWMRLWKLHGSVAWHPAHNGADNRIIRTQPSESGEMILPSYRKYDESRKQPYVAYMDRLARLLNIDHALLITCGYSFGDEHVNAILYGALETRNTANIIALQFHELGDTTELVAKATRGSNLTVIGPNGGVISGTWGTWQLTEPVDHKTCVFMDVGFDSNALPEDEGSPAATSSDLRGRLRLGDFTRSLQS
jgi:hypothetical protein